MKFDARDLAPTRTIVWLLAYIGVWWRYEGEKAEFRRIDVANKVTEGGVEDGAREWDRVALAGRDGGCRSAYRPGRCCEVVDSVGERRHVVVRKALANRPSRLLNSTYSHLIVLPRNAPRFR